MGAVFGFSFGFLDVEDDTWQHQRFSKDQSIASCMSCLPVLSAICVTIALQPWVPSLVPSLGSSTTRYLSGSKI